jgi:glutaredoxin
MLSWLFGAGGEPREVLMYTRQGCHLCDDAWALLERAARRHRLSLTKIDVDTEPALAQRYGECVPVVVIDGRERFRGVVNEVLLERVLRGPAGGSG